MTSSCVKMTSCLCESGEGSPSNPLKFKGQAFQQLKRALVSQGLLFQDPEFPANLDSLEKLHGFTAEKLREDLHPDAFIVDGLSRFDFKQGDFGNCWFLSAIGSLSLLESLMVVVVPRTKTSGMIMREYFTSGSGDMENEWTLLLMTCCQLEISDPFRWPPALSSSGLPCWKRLMQKTTELIETHSWEDSEYLIFPCTSESNKTASCIVTICSKEEAE